MEVILISNVTKDIFPIGNFSWMAKVASFLVAISDIYNFPRLLNVVWCLGYPSHSAAHGSEHFNPSSDQVRIYF